MTKEKLMTDVFEAAVDRADLVYRLSGNRNMIERSEKALVHAQELIDKLLLITAAAGNLTCSDSWDTNCKFRAQLELALKNAGFIEKDADYTGSITPHISGWRVSDSPSEEAERQQQLVKAAEAISGQEPRLHRSPHI